MEYIPYTYLIGWSSLNLWYYGSKYAENANPKTLWKSYFTSSNKVKYMREKYGEPDVIQIRKTFTDAKSCTSWEYGVLKKLLSKENTNRHIWINQNVGFGEFYKENNVPEYLSYKRNEYIANRTDEQKQRDYESRLRAAANEEGRRKQSDFAKSRQNDPIYKQKMHALYSTPEYKNTRIKNSLKQFERGSDTYNTFLKAVTSDEYKEKHQIKTTKMWDDESYRSKVSAGHAKYYSDPENLKKKSEVAKASSANRIATRFLNEQPYEKLQLITFGELLDMFNEKFKYRHNIDIERLKKKFDDMIKGS